MKIINFEKSIDNFNIYEALGAAQWALYNMRAVDPSIK